MLLKVGGSDMTLRQYRLDLGWNASQLAQEAGVTRQSVALAEKGGFIQADTAKAIAEAAKMPARVADIILRARRARSNPPIDDMQLAPFRGCSRPGSDERGGA